AEDVDAPPFADPDEQDLEHAEPLRSDERLRTDDRRLDRGHTTEAFGVDLRLPVRTNSDQRIVLLDRMLLRYAVHRRRRVEHHPPHIRIPRCPKDVLRSP